MICALIQCSPDLTQFGLNESSRFNESVFELKYILPHKNFGFSEYLGLTNKCLGPQRFVKSSHHCIGITVLAGFNEFGFNESSRFNELVFDLKKFFTS